MLFETLLSMLKDVPHEISLGRMIEAFVLLGVIWRKLQPHLKKIEERLEGVELAVKKSSDADAARFTTIEVRLNALERDTHGKSLRPERFSEPAQN